MSLLSANIDQLEEAIRIFDEILPQFDDVREDVENISNVLDSTWDGAACEYFISQLRSHKKPLKNAKEVVEELRKYAKDTAEDMKKIDQVIHIITGGPVRDWVNETIGEGQKESSSSSQKTTSSSSSKKKQEKSSIEKAIDKITEPIKKITSGIKSILGGKK